MLQIKEDFHSLRPVCKLTFDKCILKRVEVPNLEAKTETTYFMKGELYNTY